MSTRSYISIQISDSSYKYIYSHHDGYLSWNGKILYKHYITYDMANKLIDGGDLSSLHENISDVVYYTSREEPYEDVKPKISDTDSFRKEFEYTYLFKSDGLGGECWFVSIDGQDWQVLEEALIDGGISVQ